MELRPLEIDGAFEILPRRHGDHRGYFARTFDMGFCVEHGLATGWVQDNESWSAQRGVIRGLHFQHPPHAETKLVRCALGAVWDVFVDLRRSSPTFGRWGAVELTGERGNMVYVPRGCAHGICTLTDGALLAYKVDAAYAPDAEGGIRWDDPDLAIPWPTDRPILSDRDRLHPPLSEFDSPF
jgi:dTDP-4-dehydrorhamnose 3,5-epimerase